MADLVDAPAKLTRVVGTVEGRAFEAKDAIAADIPRTNGFGFDGPATFIQISDFASACGLSTQGQGPSNSRILVLGFGSIDSAGRSSVPGPGTFTVRSNAQPLPNSSLAAQAYYGSGCGKDHAYSGISGTVTVTTTAAGVVVGSFDVVLSCFVGCSGPDEHLTGTFTTAGCAALNINTTPVCS